MIIPHQRLDVDLDAQELVLQALKSGQLVKGQLASQLELELAQYIGIPGAVAVSSGSAALHLALLCFRNQVKDEVIVPSYTCISLYNEILISGLKPIIVDVDLQTANIDAREVEKVASPKTAAIIVPHMFGCACKLNELLALGVPIIEDCAHAIGGVYQGRKLGSVGDIAVFSFYATKMVGGAEGGAIASRHAELIERVRDLSDYSGEKAKWKLRHSYRMSEVHAAIALGGLRKLEKSIVARRNIAVRYHQALAMEERLICPNIPSGREHVFYRFVARAIKGSNSESIRNSMRKNGVSTGLGVRLPIHEEIGQPKEKFECSHEWRRTAISLPIYPNLTIDEQDYILSCFVRAMNTNS